MKDSVRKIDCRLFQLVVVRGKDANDVLSFVDDPLVHLDIRQTWSSPSEPNTPRYADKISFVQNPPKIPVVVRIKMSHS